VGSPGGESLERAHLISPCRWFYILCALLEFLLFAAKLSKALAQGEEILSFGLQLRFYETVGDQCGAIEAQLLNMKCACRREGLKCTIARLEMVPVNAAPLSTSLTPQYPQRNVL
jgi:hypothetical protein